MRTLLGIDIGTTNTKGIILSEEGEILARASRKNTLLIPAPAAAEQSADEWWDNIVQIARELRVQNPEAADSIKGICISSQTVTVLPVDRNGRPLRNAVIWMDNRSDKQFKYILDRMGYERYVNIIGAKPSVTFLPNKLLWLKQNEPEVFAKTYKVMQASSYINYKLTGRMTMDMAQASMSQAMDAEKLVWSKDISECIGIDLEKMLPEVKPCSEIIGEVTKEAEAATGIKAGTPVVAGASDCMTAMYATGMRRIGEAGESAGTTSMIFAGSSRKSRADAAVTTKPCDIPGMPYVFDAPLTATGASIEWFLKTMGKGLETEALKQNINVFEYMNRVAENVKVGSGGVLYYPYLQGERAPLWNSYARGMFIGMNINTSTEDLARAVFEGTAFAIRHVVENIKAEGGRIESLRITGGGAKSETWAKIKASMLKVPVYLMDERSGDVPFGGALVAGRAVGIFSDEVLSGGGLIRVSKVIEPVAEWIKYYDEVYPLFVDMYAHLDSDLQRFEGVLKR